MTKNPDKDIPCQHEVLLTGTAFCALQTTHTSVSLLFGKAKVVTLHRGDIHTLTRLANGFHLLVTTQVSPSKATGAVHLFQYPLKLYRPQICTILTTCNTLLQLPPSSEKTWSCTSPVAAWTSNSRLELAILSCSSLTFSVPVVILPPSTVSSSTQKQNTQSASMFLWATCKLPPSWQYSVTPLSTSAFQLVNNERKVRPIRWSCTFHRSSSKTSRPLSKTGSDTHSTTLWIVFKTFSRCLHLKFKSVYISPNSQSPSCLSAENWNYRF